MQTLERRRDAYAVEGECRAGSGKSEHDHGDGHDHTHEHATDPHVWLGIEHAVKQVEGIRDALKDADPAHLEARMAPETPAFEAVRADVLSAWLADQRKANNAAYLQRLRKTYRVVIAGVPG